MNTHKEDKPLNALHRIRIKWVKIYIRIRIKWVNKNVCARGEQKVPRGGCW